MDPLFSYAIDLALTLLIAALLTFALRNALSRVLLDLCGTQERAHFWTLFSMIMLICMPLVIGLGYAPEAESGRTLFFGTSRQLGRNLMGYLFALAITGGFVSIFALLSPRPRPNGN
jgi:hypothetical protein